MSDVKKRRGRPVGTDYKQDKIALDLVAERMVANEGLLPMTAMKAVFDTKAFSGPGYTQIETTVARWQVKWKRHGEAALIAAREHVQRTGTPQPHCNDVTASTPSPFMPSAHWPNSVANSIWGMSTEAKQVIAAAAAFTPSADLLRAIKLGAEGLRHFEKHNRPALEAMAKLAGRSQVREAYSENLAAIRVPQIPESVIEQLKQIHNSPAVAVMREFMKNRKRS
jgi:hypothetical protein